MKLRNLSGSLVIAGVALGAGSAFAQSADSWDSSYQKKVYFGVGAGSSRLVPDTEGTIFSVQDSFDSGGTVTLGMDFSRRLSFELQYNDLGRAELIDTSAALSEIAYTETSLSGLYYLWNGFADDEYLDYDGLDTRSGFSVFGRAGAGHMDNDATGNASYSRANDIQLLVGLGVEYGLTIGLAARAEFIRYDSDAEYTGLSLLYRFGGGREVVPSVEEELPTLPAPEPITALPPPPVPAELPELPGAGQLPTLPDVALPTLDDVDSDSDGVVDASDDCPDTTSGTPVNTSGCELFNGVIDGVNFLSGSDTLTDIARSALDGIVGTLQDFPDIRLNVEAHTDSRGDDRANLELSRLRALSVVRYLISQGIAIERLQARAYGEERPIADNSTPDGRLLNRRVEFRTLP